MSEIHFRELPAGMEYAGMLRNVLQIVHVQEGSGAAVESGLWCWRRQEEVKYIQLLVLSLLHY